jgi:hypothetical protein
MTMGNRSPSPRQAALIASFATIVLALSAIIIALTADAWYLALIPVLIMAGSGSTLFMAVKALRDRGEPSTSK